MAAGLDQLVREALAAGDGGETVIDYEGRSFSRQWLRQTASAVSDALAGIATQPTGLGFVARNRPAAIAALLGMIAANRTISMIYAYQSPEALAETVAKLGLQALVIWRRDLSEPVRAVAAREGIAVIAVDEDEGVGLALPGRPASGPEAPRDPPCIRLLTSGTTGRPKHHPLGFEAIAGFARDGAAGVAPQAAGMPTLIFYPLGNISGVMVVLPALLAGRSIVLLDRFDVGRWRDFVVRWQLARANIPPAGFGMILDAGVPPEDLASVRIASTGSAALDPAIQTAFEQRYGVKVLTAYGATEFAGTAAAWTEVLYDEWIDRKRGSVGQACAGVAIRAVDPASGEVLAPGEQGVMEVRIDRLGPSWIRTTDLGIVDADGFVFLHGRADGAIMRGGFKILPEAIESALISHPDVAAAAVVGVADARLGAVPAGLVQPVAGRGSPDPESLRAFLRERLPSTHLPARLWIVERIPRTPSLKIDRATTAAEIRDRMASEQG